MQERTVVPVAEVADADKAPLDAFTAAIAAAMNQIGA